MSSTRRWSWACWFRSQKMGGMQGTIFCRQPFGQRGSSQQMPLRSSEDCPGGCCLLWARRVETGAGRGSARAFLPPGFCGSRYGSSRGAGPARGCRGCRGCWGSAKMGSGCSEIDQGSAPGCAACLCETSCRGRGCVYVAGCQNHLCGPLNPDHRAIGQTHRRGRGDSTPGRRYQRGVEAGPLGARGAGSLLLGAGLGAPHLRAGPAQQEKSGCRRLESRVPPPPGDRCQGCQVSSPQAAPPERKGGHCLPDWQYCSIVWPRPFPATAGSLPSPRPPRGLRGGGVSLAPGI